MPVIYPLGLSPIGFLVPTTVGLAPAPVIAAELRDPKTLDVGSLLRSADPIDDQVQIAMRARRGSGAALGTTGQRYRDILKLSNNVERLLESETRTVLATLVDRGDIAIESITVETDSSAAWAQVSVAYINRRAIGQKSRQHVVTLEASTQ